MSNLPLAPRALLRTICVALCIGGCARSAREVALTEPIDYYTPVQATSVVQHARLYTALDGAQLGYFEFLPAGKPNRTSIIYLHGIESHAGWFEETAYLLAERGYTVYALDRRGSGINRENRGFSSGHIDSFQTLIDDVHAFVGQVPRAGDRIVLAGLSWGGKLALACAIAHPRTIDEIVLMTPGFSAIVDLSLLQKIRLISTLPFRPMAPFDIPIEAAMFTEDPEWLDQIERDPLRLRQATAKFLFESRKLDSWLDRRIDQNVVPIILFLAGKDRIIDNEATVAFLGRGRQPKMLVHFYEDQTHSVQLDVPERLVGHLDQWFAKEDPGNVADRQPHRSHLGQVRPAF